MECLSLFLVHDSCPFFFFPWNVFTQKRCENVIYLERNKHHNNNSRNNYSWWAAVCLRLVLLHGFPAKWTQSVNNSYLPDAGWYSPKPGKTAQKKKNTFGLEIKSHPFLSSVCNFHIPDGATEKAFMMAFLGILIVSKLFIFLPLPAAVVSYRCGNHLTLTLSWDHIDFLAAVIAIKTATWGDWGQQQCQHLPAGGAANPDDFIRILENFVYQQNERGNLGAGSGGWGGGGQQKKAEPLICLQMKWADWKWEG